MCTCAGKGASSLFYPPLPFPQLLTLKNQEKGRSGSLTAVLDASSSPSKATLITIRFIQEITCYYEDGVSEILTLWEYNISWELSWYFNSQGACCLFPNIRINILASHWPFFTDTLTLPTKTLLWLPLLNPSQKQQNSSLQSQLK